LLTPSYIIRKINADENEIVKSKDVIKKFAALGAEPYLIEPQEFAAKLQADIGKWGKVVKSSGTSVD